MPRTPDGSVEVVFETAGALGIVLALQRDGRTLLKEVKSEGRGAAQGLCAGQELLACGGTSVSGVALDEVLEHIKSAPRPLVLTFTAGRGRPSTLLERLDRAAAPAPAPPMRTGNPNQAREVFTTIQQQLPRLVGRLHDWVDKHVELAAFVLFVLLILVNYWWDEDGEDKDGVWGFYLYVTESKLMQQGEYIFVGLLAREVPRRVRQFGAKWIARANFERHGFDDRVNISLNSLARGSSGGSDQVGTLQLRTLAELSLDKVLPNKGAKNVYLQALQWTDTKGNDEDEGNTPAEYDPFVSLSKTGRDKPLPSGLERAGTGEQETHENERKHHQMVSDQLKNLISAPYAVGHIGKDMGLQYSTHEYVWGVTYERRDSDGIPIEEVSRKARVLVVRKDVLERIHELDVKKMIGDGQVGYSKYVLDPVCFVYTCRRLIDLLNDCRYRRDRWERLKTLQRLYAAEKAAGKEKRCFLVGSIMITVAKPGGETAGTTIPWEEMLGEATVPEDQMMGAATLSTGRSTSTGSDLFHSISNLMQKTKSKPWYQNMVKQKNKLRKKLSRAVVNDWQKTLMGCWLAVGALHAADVIDLYSAKETGTAILCSRVGQIIVGAFAKDIIYKGWRFLAGGRDQIKFGEKGFADRLNISLNSFIIDDALAAPVGGGSIKSNYSMELRTMAEMGIEEVLPSQGARGALYDALRWTDRNDNKLEKKPAGFDPFVCLSQEHAALGKGDDASGIYPQTAVDETPDVEIKKTWKMSKDQLINLISSPFAAGHVGEDMRQNYTTREYVWGVAYERDEKQQINQKLRVLLIQTESLRQIHGLKTDEQMREFEEQMIR